jgi:GNAT superfamily N-acetyltransferase
VVRVRPVAPETTFPLRQRILRPHQRVEDLAQPDDAAADSATFAAFDDEDEGENEVIAAGTVGRRPPPPNAGSDTDGWQVRGMAVEPAHQGQGIGSLVLAAILDHVAARGGGLTWCNARLPARGLYEQAGFTAVGEVFEIDPIGPHLLMVRQVPARPVSKSSP